MLIARLMVAVVMLAAAVLVSPTASFGQTFDHLACTAAPAGEVETDELPSTALTDYAAADRRGRIRIDALDDRFDARGCKVRRARMQCGSRARVSLDPAQPLGFVEGDETADDMVCYRVRCRRAGGPANLASDAFGTRRIGRLRSQLLCVPVV